MGLRAEDILHLSARKTYSYGQETVIIKNVHICARKKLLTLKPIFVRKKKLMF